MIQWKKDAFKYLLLIIFLGILPYIVQDEYLVSTFAFTGIFSIAMFGLVLLIGYGGLLSLGHGAFFGIGVYATGILTVKAGLPPIAAFLIGIVVSSLIACIIGFPALRLIGFLLAIATLGFGIIISIVWEELVEITGGVSGLPDVPPFSIFGYTVEGDFQYYYLIWTIAVIIMILTVNIANSRIGRALLAIQGDEEAADAMGINILKYKIKIFALSAAYASIAGSLYAHYVEFASPGSCDLMVSLMLPISLIIAGRYSVWGGIIGAILYVNVPILLEPVGDYNLLAFGMILLLIMIFMPQGLAGGLESLFNKIREKVFKPDTA